MSEREVFEAALELPPEDRAAFLDGACGGDAALRQRLEALLRKHDRAGSFLEEPVVAGALAADAGPQEMGPQAEAVGQVLAGRYQLLEPIGEGGMGSVWLAQQTEPVKRLVAVKLILTGLGSKAVLARFEAERQALALMDHPHIAKVHDAGTTTDGRPFFVMELVKGVPITKYCDEHRLTPRQRLELLVPVCQAVQHAHQKGVIHRDLKPSNVLVALYDGQPVPKVIDFGVAKATGPRLTEQTLVTAFGTLVGTLEYMSPEQAELNQLDVDTRSDIYSLGVVLYELLTGTTPLEGKRLKEASLLEALRTIREEEPPKPSTRISTLGQAARTVSAQRQSEPRHLSQLCRGELDWIVMKCLEKNRTQRYETANSLALDLQRYLRDEAVEACPPSRRYRLKKFARRYKKVLALAMAFAALLVLGTVVSAWQAVRATLAEGRARESQQQTEAERRKAHQSVNDYFTLVSESTLLQEPSLEPLRQQLLQTALRYYQEFVAEHGADPELRAELAATYFRISVLAHEVGPDVDWLTAFQKCVALVEELLRDRTDASSLLGLRDGIYRVRASTTLHCPRPEEAVLTLKQACVLWQELARLDPTAPGFRNDLAVFYQVIGFLYEYAGVLAESLPAYETACALWRQLARAHPRVAHYQAALANSLTGQSQSLTLQGRVAEAEGACREALQVEKQLLAEYPEVPGWRDLLSGYTAWQFGSVLEHAGKPREAEEAYRQMLAGQESLLRDYPSVPRYRSGVLRARQWLGELLWAAGRHEEAAEQYRQARALGDKLGPAEAESRHLLAWSLATCPDPHFRDANRAVQMAREVVKQAPDNGIYWITLGAALDAAGDHRAAAEALEKATQLPNRDVSYARFLLAMACWQLGEKDQARKWYDLAAAQVDLHEVRYAEILRFRAEAEKVLGIRGRKN